jgi:TonB family protein
MLLCAQAGAQGAGMDAGAPASAPAAFAQTPATREQADMAQPTTAVVTVFTSAFLETADAMAGLIQPPPLEGSGTPGSPGHRQTTAAPPARPAQLAAGQDCAPRPQDYPSEALRARATGVTRLRIAVDGTGQAAKIDIVRSAGTTRAHALLDEEATRRLVTCRFEPARDRQGQPMRADFDAEVVWTLP